MNIHDAVNDERAQPFRQSLRSMRIKKKTVAFLTGRTSDACASACEPKRSRIAPCSAQFRPRYHIQSDRSAYSVLLRSCETCRRMQGRRGGARVNPNATLSRSRRGRCPSWWCRCCEIATRKTSDCGLRIAEEREPIGKSTHDDPPSSTSFNPSTIW
jgi:hypothetical protein